MIGIEGPREARGSEYPYYSTNGNRKGEFIGRTSARFGLDALKSSYETIIQYKVQSTSGTSLSCFESWYLVLHIYYNYLSLGCQPASSEIQSSK